MSKKIASLYAEIGADTTKLEKGLKGTKTALGGVAAAFESVTGISLGTAAAFGSVVNFLRESVQEAAEAQRIQAQLGAVLKSTGGAAGMTADEVNKLAMRLSDLSSVEDDQIVKASALMLTFTRISKEVFPDAMTAALDLSTALGQDLQQSVTMVSKMLNVQAGDTTMASTAMNAARRVGVAFTEDQMALAKQLVETGDMMGYQKLILEELNTEFGGSAAAMGGTYAGQVAKLTNEYRILQEEIGMKLIPVLTDAAGALNTLMAAERKITDALNEHDQTMQTVAKTYDEYISEMFRAAYAAGEFNKYTGLNVEWTLKNRQETERMAKALGFLTEGQFLANQSIAAGTEEAGFLRNAISDLTGETETYDSTLASLYESVFSVDDAMKAYNETLLYNKASAGLNAEDQLALGRALGLVDESTVLAMTRLDNLRESYASGKLTAEEYRAAVKALNDQIQGIQNKTVTIGINVNWTGDLGELDHIGKPGVASGYREEGGPVTRGGSYVVGEEGPEMFVPSTNGYIVPAGQTAALANSTINNTYNLTVNSLAAANNVVRDFDLMRM